MGLQPEVLVERIGKEEELRDKKLQKRAKKIEKNLLAFFPFCTFVKSNN